jgi:7-cyano-7-deazaguanine synthase
MKAIILLSGGLDSLVCAAISKYEGDELYGLSFNYDQKHLKEINFSKMVAAVYCKEHKVLQIPSISPKDGNYFPARNTIFLSFALSYAEIVGAGRIIIGVNGDDTFFPDCLPEYINAFQGMASVATKQGDIEIITPLIKMDKREIISIGNDLKVDFLNTMTCYNGNNCGVCASCKLRRESFTSLGLSDPIKYLI